MRSLPFLKSSIFAFVVVVPLLASCALPAKFEYYPNPISDASKVDSDVAVVIIGNEGPIDVNYLQFGHSSLPAINVKGGTMFGAVSILDAQSIVAIPIPIGIKQLSLSDYTSTKNPGRTLPNGMEFGYIRLDTPALDITEHGLYYMATIIPGTSAKYSVKPDAKLLEKFKRDYPNLSKMRPINFVWP